MQKHLRVLEVVAPQRPDLVLAADVPHRERDVLVLDCFDVEAWKGKDCHVTYLIDTASHINLTIIPYSKIGRITSRLLLVCPKS